MNPVSLSRKRTLFSLLIATQLLFAASVTHAQTYQVTNTETTIVADDLSRTVTTVQSGPNPLNRFFITKVTKAGLPEEGLKGAILLLPPLGSGFQNYEASDNGDYNNSFVAFFARRNFVIVGYSPRQQGLVARSCESGAIDCSPMADWGLQTIVSDATFIRSQIATQFPNLNVVIGGLSMGSIASMATLNLIPTTTPARS